MSSLRTIPAALAVAAAVALGLAGCSAPAPEPAAVASDPVSGGTLTYLAGAEPPVWDGQRIPSLGLNSINSSIFDTLIAQDSDGTYEPDLATA